MRSRCDCTVVTCIYNKGSYNIRIGKSGNVTILRVGRGNKLVTVCRYRCIKNLTSNSRVCRFRFFFPPRRAKIDLAKNTNIIVH